MTDRLDDGNADNKWGWVPGAIFVIAVVGGLAFWAYSSGDLQRSASRTDPPTTTGQGTQPPARPAP